jgi:hypothetical protein
MLPSQDNQLFDCPDLRAQNENQEQTTQPISKSVQRHIETSCTPWTKTNNAIVATDKNIANQAEKKKRPTG